VKGYEYLCYSAFFRSAHNAYRAAEIDPNHKIPASQWVLCRLLLAPESDKLVKVANTQQSVIPINEILDWAGVVWGPNHH
jgi:acetone carboxylase gamma subunit